MSMALGTSKLEFLWLLYMTCISGGSQVVSFSKNDLTPNLMYHAFKGVCYIPRLPNYLFLTSKYVLLYKIYHGTGSINRIAGPFAFC